MQKDTHTHTEKKKERKNKDEKSLLYQGPLTTTNNFLQA